MLAEVRLGAVVRKTQALEGGQAVTGSTEFLVRISGT